MEISSFIQGTNLKSMKQITMNGTANALQVVAVLFLFGNSVIAPGKRSKDTVTTTVHNVKQNNEKQNRLSTYDIMASYFHEVASDRLSQPLYLHPVISTGTSNVKTVHTMLPLPPKK